MCLAQNIYFEARNQSPDGQMMVAEVTLNRVASQQYPDNVCDVVWQRKQFSWTQDGKSDTPLEGAAWELAQEVAKEALSGKTLGSSATHYHATYTSPKWASSKRMKKLGQVGTHIFYKDTKA